MRYDLTSPQQFALLAGHLYSVHSITTLSVDADAESVDARPSLYPYGFVRRTSDPAN